MCDFDGCSATFSQIRDLSVHKRIHTGEKPYVCDADGCNVAFRTSGHLVTHKRIHTGAKPYVCDVVGCNASFSQSSHLVTHKHIHTGTKPYVCDAVGCNAAFTRSGILAVHKRVHTGEKPYVCDVDGCDLKFAQSGHLITHKRAHTGEKPYVCNVDGCNAIFAQSSHLISHVRSHTGEKPYICDIDGCDVAFANSGSLKYHIQSMHSIEGVKRHKKQEDRVRTLLAEWDFVVDEEVTINVGRRDCVPDTNRQSARVDFVVVSCTSCILIVECDEAQHYWYELSCECSRMADVVTALRMAECVKPVYFLRYSPNGSFNIDGVKYSHLRRKIREDHLKARILDISNGPEPKQLLTIEYMFYDSEDGIPLVVTEEDYPSALAASVVPSQRLHNLTQTNQ